MPHFAGNKVRNPIEKENYNYLKNTEITSFRSKKPSPYKFSGHTHIISKKSLQKLEAAALRFSPS
jgi:hypothetical protein